MASLIVVSGKSRGFCFKLEQDTVTAGRDELCDFQILDELVSRRHMQIKRAEERHAAMDFESANGVFVNGSKIDGEAILGNGDIIHIGGTTMVYATDDSEEALGRLDVMRRKGERRRSTIVGLD